MPLSYSTSEDVMLAMARRAYDVAQEGNHSDAIALYGEAIQQFPEQPFFYACRSILNTIVDDEEGAFYDYQVAKKLDFNYHIFLEWLEAKPATKKEVENYNDLKSLLNNALDATQQFDYLHALALYSHAVDKFSGSATVLVYRGTLHMRLLQYDKALENFNEALRIDPFHFQAYLSRAKLYEAIRENTYARSDFDRATEIDPENNLIYEERGNFLINQGLFSEALSDFDKLADMLPEDFFVFALRADLHEKLENWEKALEDYDRAIALNPYYSDLYAYRASIKERLGDIAGADADRKVFQEMDEED